MNGFLLALQAIQALLALVPEGSALYTQWTAKKTLVQTIISENRDPTAEEWAQLDAQVAADEAAIDAAAKG